MHASESASRQHTLGRSRQRSRAQSDPGQPYVTPPYTIQWPSPARQTTEPVGAAPGTPYPRSSSRSSSIERTRDTFVPNPGSLLSHYQIPNSSGASGTSPSRSVSPRSPSPQQRQGSTRAPQGRSEPLINLKDVTQAPRTALNAPSVAVVPHPYPASWGQGQGFPLQSQNPPPTPTHFQSASMQRHGSYHVAHPHQHPPAGVYQITNATHHYPSSHHQPTTSHHITHHRSRPRPPSAASHRYASSITQPMYGHGSSASLNASRTSLNGGVPSQRNHHATPPPPGMPASHHPGTGHIHMPAASPQRSRSQTRVPSSDTSDTTAMAQSAYRFEGTPPNPLPPRAANELHRSTQRPALPENYDGQTQTRYVNMLLALDEIPPLSNILAAFFTWILLAGFLLFPGTFASWKDVPAGSPQSDILDVVNHVSLYVIAWICTGVGGSGMIWLWWKWQNNYIWIKNRIFVPGCLNSVAGVISTLSSIYGAQGGVFGESEKTTIIVTGAVSLVCGTLVIVYEFWFLRNVKLEHDHEVGVEMVGKHGEGVMGEKRDGEMG